MVYQVLDYASQTEAELNQKMATWTEDPTRIAGWLHNYFCDDDGERLIFDLHKPTEFECPYCHRIYTDEKKRNAWYALYREAYITDMCDATLYYLKTKEVKYLDFVKKIFRFYCDSFDELPIHIHDNLVDINPYIAARKEFEKVNKAEMVETWFKKNNHLSIVGPAKMLGQGLDDAVAMMKFGVVYTLLTDEFTNEEKQAIKDKFFQPMKSFLESQLFAIHNITLWRESAVQILNLILENGEYTINRTLGIKDHLLMGTTADYLWYEGSFHYHFYVTEALSYLTFFINAYGLEEPVLKKYLYQMLYMPCESAFENGELPNPNDGWANLHLLNYSKVFEIAAVSYPNDPAFYFLYNFVKKFEGSLDKGVEHTFFTPIYLDKMFKQYGEKETYIPRITHDFRATKFTILNNKDLQVFIKKGINSVSHAHHDTFNHELAWGENHLIKDAASTGYGAELNDIWYRTLLAHNSIILNDDILGNMFYSTEILEETNHMVKMSTQNAFEKSIYQEKTFSLEEQKFILESVGKGDKSEKFALIQHFEVDPKKVTTNVEMILTQHPLFDDKPNAVRNITRSVQAENQFQLFLEVDGKKVEVVFTLNKPIHMYLLTTIGNPSVDNRTSIYFEEQETLDIKMQMTFPKIG